MTKSEQREVSKLQQWHAAGLVDTGTHARSLSALIRASMSGRTTAQLLQQARAWQITNHPEFII
jgi:hypothetical protein